MRYLRLLFLICSLLLLYYNAISQNKFQYDTVYFNIPELKVNQKSFLRSLNRIINKTSFCEDKKNGATYINVITINLNADSNYVFTVLRSKLHQSEFRFSKGYFKTNGNYFFLIGKDSLNDYPENLFCITKNIHTFYALRVKNVSFLDGEVWMDLLYKRKRLYLIKKYW